MTSSIPNHPYGTVAYFIEQFRWYTENNPLDSAVLGSVEAAVITSTSDTTTMRRIRAALAAADIVRGEQRAARDLAQAERYELAEPSQLAPQRHPVRPLSLMAANRAAERYDKNTSPTTWPPMGGEYR